VPAARSRAEIRQWPNYSETKKKDRGRWAALGAGPRARQPLLGRVGRGLLPGRNGYLHSKLHSFSFSFSRSSFMHI